MVFKHKKSFPRKRWYQLISSSQQTSWSLNNEEQCQPIKNKFDAPFKKPVWFRKILLPLWKIVKMHMVIPTYNMWHIKTKRLKKLIEHKILNRNMLLFLTIIGGLCAGSEVHSDVNHWLQREPSSIITKHFPNIDSFKWFVLGYLEGWPAPHYSSPIKKSVADSMGWTSRIHRLEYIVGLGDNFYYHEVENENDPMFEKTFENIFVRL